MTKVCEISTGSIDPKGFKIISEKPKIPSFNSPIEWSGSCAIMKGGWNNPASSLNEISEYISQQIPKKQFNAIKQQINFSIIPTSIGEANYSTIPFVNQSELSNWQSMLESDCWNLLGKLNKYVRLSEGWNGYSAPPPNTFAVRNSRSFLFLLGSVKFIPYRLEPSVVGGIGFTFRHEQLNVYVEFYNAGNAYAIFYDSDSDIDTDTKTKPVLTSKNGYLAIIKEIREYFHD